MQPHPGGMYTFTRHARSACYKSTCRHGAAVRHQSGLVCTPVNDGEPPSTAAPSPKQHALTVTRHVQGWCKMRMRRGCVEDAGSRSSHAHTNTTLGAKQRHMATSKEGGKRPRDLPTVGRPQPNAAAQLRMCGDGMAGVVAVQRDCVKDTGAASYRTTTTCT